MRPKFYGFLILFFAVSGLVMFFQASTARAGLSNQQEPPQSSATPEVPFYSSIATVKDDGEDEINVRSGPNVEYGVLGKLYKGQQVPALGRSPGGDWVQIAFSNAPGGTAWVYAYLVTIDGTLPVVEPPPTPTPRVTPTIDATLAAQFVHQLPPTRLPTFTPPPTLTIPTFAAENNTAEGSPSMVIYAAGGLLIIGVLGMLLSFIRVR